MKTITIEIQDGILHIFDIPKDIKIIVRDYDTDGADPKHLQKDPEGIECFENIYEHD